MRALAEPAVVVSLCLLDALALHPFLRSESWLPEHGVVLVVLLLLTVSALLARTAATPSPAKAADWLVAGGALLALLGVGLDGVRGRTGAVTLAVGQTTGNFDETGPNGRSLGLRPLGFPIGVDTVTSSGVVLTRPDGGTGELTRERALRLGGFWFADPRVRATGGVARMRIAASDGRRTDVAEIVPDRPARLRDFVVTLEQYFPDFALDERQEPLTRSLEPNNPGALLQVDHDGRSHRVFVLQSAPGVHRVEPLGVAFSLLEVEPERSVAIRVHRQPFAILAAVGGLLLMAGIVLGAVRTAATQPGSSDGVLVAGAGLVSGLLLADSGHVLRWRFAVPVAAESAPLEGVGVLLGLALLAAAAGVLLLGAQRLAGDASTVAAARGALWGAVLVGAAAVVLAILRLALLPSDLSLTVALPVVGVTLALVLLAMALGSRASPIVGSDTLVSVATASLVAATLAIGAWSTATGGTYAVPATTAVAATALVGLAAREATGAWGLRRLVLLVGVLALLLRPLSMP